MRRSEDPQVDDHQEQRGNGVDGVEDGDDHDVGLDVDEDGHDDGSEDAEYPGQSYGGITPPPGDVTVVLQGMDHTHVLLQT